jgi:hypothetical protein
MLNPGKALRWFGEHVEDLFTAIPLVLIVPAIILGSFLVALPAAWIALWIMSVAGVDSEIGQSIWTYVAGLAAGYLITVSYRKRRCEQIVEERESRLTRYPCGVREKMADRIVELCPRCLRSDLPVELRITKHCAAEGSWFEARCAVCAWKAEYLPV